MLSSGLYCVTVSAHQGCTVLLLVLSFVLLLVLSCYAQVEADKAIDELQLKTGELQSIVEELKQQPDEFDIDSSVQGTNVVFNQLSLFLLLSMYYHV